MELGNIPFDIIRPIFAQLSFLSLVQLNSTNDLRIRKLFSRPGVLSVLSISNLGKIPNSSILSLLVLLKDVKHLSILAETHPDLVRPALLQRLNPQFVRLPQTQRTFKRFDGQPTLKIAHNHAQKTLLKCIESLPRTLRTLSLNLHCQFNLLPLLRILDDFSSLDTLVLFRGKNSRKDLSGPLPASLTALSLHDWEFIDRDITSLNMASSNLITATLDIDNHKRNSNPVALSTALPLTLKTLTIATNYHYTSFPINLETLCLVQTEVEPEGLLMTIYAALYALPNLQRLCITAYLDSVRFCASNNEGSIPTHERHPYLVLAKLPRTLQCLEIPYASHPLSKEMVAELPRGLLLLSVSEFDLSLIADLHKAAPNCRLLVTHSFGFWTSTNGVWLTQNEFERHWTAESFDFVAWQHHIAQWSIANNVSFNYQVKYDITNPRRVYFPGSLTAFQAKEVPWNFLHTLDEDCPNLTHVDTTLTGEAPAGVQLELPSLKHLNLRDSSPNLLPLVWKRLADLNLSASSTYECSLMPSKSLTHLDTPNWTFKAENILSAELPSLRVLRCGIRDLPDLEVIPLLKRLTATCPNVALSMTYYVTGHLLTTSSASNYQTITWDQMKSETDVILKKLLLEPLPFVPASEGSPSAKTLSNAVVSLSPTMAPNSDCTICTPQTASTIALDLGKEFYWASGVSASSKSGALAALGNKFSSSQERSKKVLEPHRYESGFTSEDDEPALQKPEFGLKREPPRFGFASVLVNLTLLNVVNPEQWLLTLPSTLRSLHFSTSQLLPTLNWSLPPKLARLVLELSVATRFLPFKLSALPSTIEYIGISSPVITLHQDDTKAKKDVSAPIRLPLLKTFYVSHPVMILIHTLCSKLEIHPEGRIIVQELHETPLKDQLNSFLFGQGISSHAVSKSLIDYQQLVLEPVGGKSLEELVLAEISPISAETKSSAFSASRAFSFTPASTAESPSPSFSPLSDSSPSSPSLDSALGSMTFSSNASSASTARRKAVRAPRK